MNAETLIDVVNNSPFKRQGYTVDVDIEKAKRCINSGIGV